MTAAPPHHAKPARRPRGCAWRFTRVWLAVFLLALFLPAVLPARSLAAEAIAPDVLAAVFPGAERAGGFAGEPKAAPVYADGARVGYLFSTWDVVGSVGFSGKPIDILVGLGNDGRVAGTYLRRHNEPILIIGIPHERLKNYVADFAGLDVRTRIAVAEVDPAPPGLPDAISGASISSLVIRDAILRSARVVARARGLLNGGGGARLDRESFAPGAWDELIADGSIAGLRLTRSEMAAAFAESNVMLESSGLSSGAPDDLFIQLYAGLLTPPRVGQNLLGKLAFNRLVARAGAEDQAILIAADGLYSFKGTGFVRSGLFDRVQVVQGEKTIRLTTEGYQNVERFSQAGAPELREIGVFVIPAGTGFDPLAPWRVELLVGRKTEGGGIVHVGFALDYELPDRYRLPAAGGEAMAGTPADQTSLTDDGDGREAALWQEIWRERGGRIAIIAGLLAVLTVVLVFQDAVVRNWRLYRTLRLGFLAVTLVWLGWYAGAQLSVVNVLTFAHALLTGFRWELFLLEPLIFILWAYVAVAMLFWGRGVFCGWLCPFGALQELLNEGALWLRIPQLKIPFAVHERLWPIKYVIFLGLFAVSLHSTNLAVLCAEVEPFKTAITLKFLRHWPFALYALALLGAGIFVERFFCRYLCPLGAALAIPARLRMFDWLKRKYQCGRSCHTCAAECTIQAIHPNGAINPNECIHCLNCQALYYDDTTCPPLVAQRQKRRGARGAAPEEPA